MALANEKVIQARSPKQQQLDQKRARLEELVRQRAQMIIKQNAAYLGRQTADSATRLIEEDKNKEEGGTEDVEEKPKRGRRKKSAVNE